MEFYCERLESNVNLEDCPDCAEHAECKASGYYLKITAQHKEQTFFVPKDGDSEIVPHLERVQMGSGEAGEKRDAKNFSWNKWRWEFMRRDPEVQKAYEEILALRGEAGEPTPEACPYPEIQQFYKNILDLKEQGKKIPPEMQDGFRPPTPWCNPYSFDEDGKPNSFCYACTDQGQKEATYCTRYGLNGVIFLDINKKFEELPGGPLAALFIVKSPVKITVLGPEKTDQEGGDKVDKKIFIEIDFNYVNSVKKLTNDLSEKVGEYYKMFNREEYDPGMKDDKTAKKRASKNYELILRAGDLRSEDPIGHTHDQIASELLEEKANTKPSSASRTIGYALKDYENLTKEGGWKKILPI